MGLKSYMFDLGDSNTGPIGLVVRVRATDEDQAVQIARGGLRLVTGNCGEISVKVPAGTRDDIEYINIYINPDNVAELDIYDEEMEADVDPTFAEAFP